MKVVVSNTVALNAGDAAILQATLDILGKYLGPLDVRVFGVQTESAARYYPQLHFRPALHGQLTRWAGTGYRLKAAAALLLSLALLSRLIRTPALFALLPRGLRNGLADYRKAEVVISAGGTYLVPHYRLEPKLLDMLLVLALGRPLILFTQSLGPFPPNTPRRLLRFVLRRAHLILVRDERSLAHLAALGVAPAKVRRCADAAFALALPPLPHRRNQPTGQPLQVAISVRDWPHFAGTSHDSGMRRYLDAMAELVQMLVADYDAEVTFLSTCQGVPEYWTDDARLATTLVRQLPPTLAARVRVDSSFHTPDALRARLAQFDILVATRLHAAILALCAGTMVMPLAYEFKTLTLFERLGLGDLVLDIETIDGATLCRRFVEVLARWSDRSHEIWKAVAEQRASAYSAGHYVEMALAERP